MLRTCYKELHTSHTLSFSQQQQQPNCRAVGTENTERVQCPTQGARKIKPDIITLVNENGVAYETFFSYESSGSSIPLSVLYLALSTVSWRIVFPRPYHTNCPFFPHCMCVCVFVLFLEKNFVDWLLRSRQRRRHLTDSSAGQNFEVPVNTKFNVTFLQWV